MKRGPLIFTVLIIEVVVALILYYNYQFLADRLRGGSTVTEASPTQPSTVAASSSGSAAIPTLDPAVIAAATASAASVPVPTAVVNSGTLIPELSPAILTLFDPLPVEAPPGTYLLTDELVTLGRALYYDPRLSVDQRQSCNTCHLLDRDGVDGLPVSLGHDGEPVKRNAPTVYNAALHIAQFWDGRAATVEDQAKGPILNAGEMGMLDPEEVEAKINSFPGYAPLFAAAFPGNPDPVSFENVAQAIAAFERRLMTPARFDRFLAGDYSQLSEAEQHGLVTFADVGCPTCHVGVTVGGLLYKKLGEKVPYPVEDLGRFLVTGDEADRHVFKVPSLRNVTRTGPYLHDGSIATLEEMVVLMARHQLDKAVTDQQVAEIITFLQTLEGEIPTDYIAPPPLP